MSLLDLLTLRHVCEIVDRAVPPHSHRRKDMLAAPGRRDGLGGELLRSLCSHLLLEATNGGELGTEVGEHLSQRCLRKLGDVDRAEATATIVETVAPLADLRWDEAERIAVIADPPIHTFP